MTWGRYDDSQGLLSPSWSRFANPNSNPTRTRCLFSKSQLGSTDLENPTPKRYKPQDNIVSPIPCLQYCNSCFLAVSDFSQKDEGDRCVFAGCFGRKHKPLRWRHQEHSWLWYLFFFFLGFLSLFLFMVVMLYICVYVFIFLRRFLSSLMYLYVSLNLVVVWRLVDVIKFNVSIWIVWKALFGWHFEPPFESYVVCNYPFNI